MSSDQSQILLALCVAGVWIFWSLHDYLQERLFRAPGFHFGLFMAFTLQVTSFLLSLVHRTAVWLAEQTFSTGERRNVHDREEAQRRRAELEEEARDELQPPPPPHPHPRPCPHPQPQRPLYATTQEREEQAEQLLHDEEAPEPRPKGTMLHALAWYSHPGPSRP